MPRFNIPPVTRALLITLTFQSILSAAIRYRQWTENAHIIIPYLTLVPQLSLAFPWTFLTSTLVEGNIFTIAISAATLHYGGRYLERAWSSKELAKFMVLVSLVPNFLTFCTLFIFFAVTRNENWTYVSLAVSHYAAIPMRASFRKELLTNGVFYSDLPSSGARFLSRYPSSSHSASSSRRIR